MSNSLIKDAAWGAAARDWAEVQEGLLQPLFETVISRTEVGPGKKVLDVACGTGLFCTLALKAGAEVTGVDASVGQIALAQERVPGARFMEAEMEKLPFERSTFDLITCCNALQYAQDSVEALLEMGRVARPGGTIGILTRGLTGPHASNVSFAALAPFRPPPAPDAPPMTIFREPGALEKALTAAGLTIYEDRDVECDWSYPDLETALRGVLSFAPAVRAIRLHGPDEVRNAVGAALAPFRTESGGYHLPNRMRYVLARTGNGKHMV